jgi:hypothetical protein
MRIARQRVTQPVAYMRVSIADLADCLRAVARRALHDFDTPKKRSCSRYLALIEHVETAVAAGGPR